MKRVQADSSLLTLLNGLNEEVEVCDETGRTLGHYLPADQYKKLLYAAAAVLCPISEEELQRRRKEPRGRTLAEIWTSLGQA